MAEYKKDYAPRTVRKTMGIVGNILKDAERQKLAVGNPVGLLQLPKVTTTDRLWLTETDVRALVEAVRASHGDKFATLVGQLLARGGLEAAEAVHRDDLQALAPGLWAGSEPGLERLLGAAFDHVQQT